MKYFIVGLHSSGKQEVNDILKTYGIKCGKLFSNLKKEQYTKSIYNKNYEYFDISEVNKIFENNAYIFFQDIPDMLNASAFKCFEGLSKYEFENNDVFVLSPDQVLNIAPNTMKEQVCYIWLDNKKSNRKLRHFNEKREYSFNERETLETRDINTFVKTIYNSTNTNGVLYFTDEEPERIAAILYSVIKHPDLLDLYKKNFI